MGAGLCCGPRDALMVGLGKRVRKIPIGVVNMMIFATVVLVTLVLRGPIRNRYAAGCGAAGPDHAAGVPYHAL